MSDTEQPTDVAEFAADPSQQVLIKHPNVKALGYCLQSQLAMYEAKGWARASDDDLAAERERVAKLPPKKQAMAAINLVGAAPIMTPGPKQQAAIQRQAERDAEAAKAAEAKSEAKDKG